MFQTKPKASPGTNVVISAFDPEFFQSLQGDPEYRSFIKARLMKNSGYAAIIMILFILLLVGDITELLPVSGLEIGITAFLGAGAILSILNLILIAKGRPWAAGWAEVKTVGADKDGIWYGAHICGRHIIVRPWRWEYGYGNTYKAMGTDINPGASVRIVAYHGMPRGFII